MSSLNDGMGFEEVQVDSNLVTSSQNIYATTISGTTLQGSVISGATAKIGATVFSSTTSSGVALTSVLSGADARFTAVNLAGKNLSPAGTGSSTLTWGRFVEAGSATLGAGSTLWLVFPTAFTVGPFLQLQTLGATAGNNDLYVSGARDVGSAFIMGKTASEAFNWLAIG
jgi:hypothetical protein